MSLKPFELIPRDVLFLRDARPMEASDAGLGANWPRPDQLYSAIHHAFLSRWPNHQDWEGEGLHVFRDKRLEEYRGRSKDKNSDSSLRFGALKTIGPFPCRRKTGDNPEERDVFLPCPLDLGMELIECKGTDLPAPLTFAFSLRHEVKASLPKWISQDEYRRYFEAAPESYFTREGEDWKFVPPTQPDPELYGADRNIGIGTDRDSGATRKGAFYQAEYLRLSQDVTMAFMAECVQKGRHVQTSQDIFSLLPKHEQVVFGGQQGVCMLSPIEGDLFPDLNPAITTPWLRWTLLSPAVFNAGWLPGWVDGATGAVQLRAPVERLPGERRADWKVRQNDQPLLPGRLVAARVGKPEPFSGWSEAKGKPKPTLLAVPAGSSYVFKCESTTEAQTLAQALQPPTPRSDLFGEKGFGIGVCSSMQPPEATIL